MLHNYLLYTSFWKVSDATWQYSISKDGTEYLCRLYLEGYLHGMKSYMDMKIYIGFRHDFGKTTKLNDCLDILVA